MNTKNIVLSLVTGLAFTAFIAGLTPARAQECTTQYGGNTTCMPADLTINKQVQNPSNGVFVENLGTNDPKYTVGQNITFQLTVTNSSGQTFNPVTVNDVFPSNLTFVSGPGSFNSGNNTLSFNINNMVAGTTQTFQVTAKVLSTNGTACENNYAEARDDSVGRFDSDTAQFCITATTSAVLGATTLPVAGVNDYLLLLPFAGVAMSGFALLRRPELVEGKKRS